MMLNFNKVKSYQRCNLSLWLLSLPGSGVDEIAKALAVALSKQGYLAMCLTESEVYKTINKPQNYQLRDIYDVTERVIDVNHLLLAQGIITVNVVTLPTLKLQELTKSKLGVVCKHVVIDVPLSVCMGRDEDSLYSKASQGHIYLPSINTPFEKPVDWDIAFNYDGGDATSIIKSLIRYVNTEFNTVN